MFKDTGEMTFYVLVGIALSLALWAANLFGLKAYPFAAVLLFLSFILNPFLVYLGQKLVGADAGEDLVKIISLCAVVAFIIVWASNLGRNFLGTLAVPAALMFLIPGVLYYVRQVIYRSETDVRPE